MSNSVASWTGACQASLHYFPELAQVHVHWVSVAIQPSHSLSPPSHPALNLSHIRSSPLSQLFVSSGQCTVVVAQSLVVSSSSTPWTEAHQGSLPFTICRSLLKLMSIESLMPSKHLILCHPLLLLPSIFPSIRIFSNESALRIRWPKY